MGRKSWVWWVVTLVLWWSKISMGEYIKYKDPNQPVEVRVKDLLDQMTLEEKIGQMVQIDRTVATIQIMKDFYIGNISDFFSINVSMFIPFVSICLSNFDVQEVLKYVVLNQRYLKCAQIFFNLEM